MIKKIVIVFISILFIFASYMFLVNSFLFPSSDWESYFESSSYDLLSLKVAVDRQLDPSSSPRKVKRQVKQLASRIQRDIPPNASDFKKLTVLRQFLFRPGEWNDFRPFDFDFSDPLGQRLQNHVLSELLDTKKGNCVSLPILTLILAQRLGLDATLSVAPLHVFVKVRDSQTGQVYNIETTSGGGITRNVWYQQELSIPPKTIQNGVYLSWLNDQEIRSVILMSLHGYHIRKKEYDQSISIATIALKYYPKYVYAMLKKGHSYAHLMTKALKDRGLTPYVDPRQVSRPDIAVLHRLMSQNHYWFEKAEALGWRERSQNADQLYLSKVKQFHSNTNRFIGHDPVSANYERPESLNRYHYGYNNPMGYVDPDGRRSYAIMNFQSSVQHAYYQDTGRNANEDWQYLPNVPGDMIQAVPDWVYSGTGLAISGIAVATGATILSPVGLAGLGVTALSTSKTILNHNEGKISNKDAIINITSDFGTMALPGKTGLAVESGIFINDLVRDINKRNNDNN